MNNYDAIDLRIRIPLTKSSSTNDIPNLTNVKGFNTLTKSSSLTTVNDIQKVSSTCTINTTSIGNTTYDYDDSDDQIQELQEYYRNYNNLDAKRNFSFTDSKAIIRNIIKVLSSSSSSSSASSSSILLLLSIKDHKQTLQLLYQLLPQKVVSRLRNGQQILPEKFDNVTSNTTIY